MARSGLSAGISKCVGLGISSSFGTSSGALREISDDRAGNEAGQHDLEIVMMPVRLGHGRYRIREKQADSRTEGDPREVRIHLAGKESAGDTDQYALDAR